MPIREAVGGGQFPHGDQRRRTASAGGGLDVKDNLGRRLTSGMPARGLTSLQQIESTITGRHGRPIWSGMVRINHVRNVTGWRDAERPSGGGIFAALRRKPTL
jgi:hypothetical protein